MAEVIQEERYPRVISVSFSGWRIFFTGAAIGALYALLVSLVAGVVIEPLYCGSSFDAGACSDSTMIAGNITSILVAAAGLGVLVGIRVVRPLIVVGATTVLLWGLSTWTMGLAWGEAVAWSALLYAMAYLLFGWICRYNRTVLVVVLALVVSVIARIVASL